MAKTMGDYFIDDPVKAASDFVNGPMALCNHIIVLAHIDPFEIEILAHRIPKISLILGGNNRAMEYPRQIGHSLYVQTDAYGFHIGRLNLTLVKGSSGFMNVLPTNRFILLHPGMESDPEIEYLLSQSRDHLRRPLP
jgi:2',3'-cyclic-nucleotide 2'-phosphodiesterase (5'-nucleotidase family)